TQPREPVSVPRRRPVTVTIAGVLMIFGALLGIASAVMLFVAAGTVVSRFRSNAAGIEVSAQTLSDVADFIRGAYVASGVINVLLAIIVGILAFGVLNG